MAFDIFQTISGTLGKITTDGFGDPSVVNTTVKVDPVAGWKQMYNREGEVFKGLKTIVTDMGDIDVSHDKWQLTFNGRTYQVEEMTPFYSIGGNVLEHLEIVLR